MVPPSSSGGWQEPVSPGTLDTGLWFFTDSGSPSIPCQWLSSKWQHVLLSLTHQTQLAKREVVVFHSLITEGTSCCLCQIYWLETIPPFRGDYTRRQGVGGWNHWDRSVYICWSQVSECSPVRKIRS